MYILNKKWKFISLLVVFIMLFTTITAFASFESLSKDVDRTPRIYYEGEEVIFSAKIENTGPYVNTYYYIQDVFNGDLDYITLYRDGNGDDTITFSGDTPVAPDVELLLDTDYFIDDSKIILRWVDGTGDPTTVGTVNPESIPTFPGKGDNTLTLNPGGSSYIEMHYIIQPEDPTLVTNEINTLGEDSAEDKLSADVTAFFRVINPDTMVNITSSAVNVYAGDTVDLTITEANTGDVDLTNVYVELFTGTNPTPDVLDENSSNFSGDTDSDGVLDVGETWQWMVNGVVVDGDTNFEVLGFGTDSLGNEVSFDTGYEGEKDDVDVYTINPDTMVNITSSAVNVYAGDTVDLTITEANTGDDPLTNVHVDVYKNSLMMTTLDETSLEFSGGDDGNGILDPGETWTWMVTGIAINEETLFEVLGFGNDSLGNEVSFVEGYENEKDHIDVYTINPDTMVNITSSAVNVYAGDTVDLTITESNTGDNDLTNVYVELFTGTNPTPDVLDENSSNFSGDTDSDGVLDVGETWQWMVNGVVVDGDTNFEVLGFGTDSLGNEVSFDTGYEGEKDDVDVYTINPDTMVSVTAEQEGASVEMVPMGDVVDLVISEKNTGDDPLTDVYVDVYQNGSMIATLDETSAEFTGGDDGDGVLEPGETWTWMITGIVINEETMFEVYGYGTDSLGNVVSYENQYMNEKDDTTVYLMPTRDETA